MNKLLKKYSIRISRNTTVLYCEKKKLVTVIGPLSTKSTKINLKLELVENNKILYVTAEPIYTLSNNNKKMIKALQGTTIALIKQLLLETSTILYKKLKFVGVGYKVFYTNNLSNQILLLRLGFSHFIYFKVSDNLKTFCLKNTKLFIYGNSFQNVAQTASAIQACKFPEPYKGKGILYENEKIQIKEGKKHK